MVEQGTENPRVVGSIPTGGTTRRLYRPEIHLGFADLAHLVERRLAKAKVAGSSPVIRSRMMRVRIQIRIRITFEYGAMAKR